MWGGQAAFTYTDNAVAAQAAAFSKYMGPNNTDRDGESARFCVYAQRYFLLSERYANTKFPLAMTGILFNFQNPGKQFTIVDTLFYTKPVANPPVFNDFLATPGKILNQFNVTTIENLVTVLGQILPKRIDR